VIVYFSGMDGAIRNSLGGVAGLRRLFHAHPEVAFTELELRATSGEVCDELDRRARAVLTAASAAHEVEVRVEQIGSATTAPCDPAAVAVFDIDEACLDIAVDTLEHAIRMSDRDLW
jgi:metal-dependent amidase/aminoacylase/carboxypeptidase family protein